MEFLTTKRDGAIPENYEQGCFWGGSAHTCCSVAAASGFSALAPSD